MCGCTKLWLFNQEKIQEKFLPENNWTKSLSLISWSVMTVNNILGNFNPYNVCICFVGVASSHYK